MIVRIAEAFMKSRLLFLEMIAQKSLKKLQLKQKEPQNLVLQTFKILTSFALSNHIQIMSQALTKLCNYLSSPVERKKQLFGISKYKLEIWKNNLTGNLERQIWRKSGTQLLLLTRFPHGSCTPGHHRSCRFLFNKLKNKLNQVLSLRETQSPPYIFMFNKLKN